jgi:DNA-binding SARP family transcriptional activator
MCGLSIHFFGAAEIRVAGGSAPVCHSALSLLAHLALSGPAVLPRDAIAADLWPDCPPERARARLSTALGRLRGALGQSLGEAGSGLELRGDGAVGLAPALHAAVDVLRFEQRARRFLAAPDAPGAAAELADTLAADRSRGEPLAGWYDDWALRARVRLEDLHERCLMRLAERFFSAGEDEAAIALAERLIEIDPLREDAHQLVMRIHARCGQAALVRRQYRRCRDALRDALGIEPSPETAALAGLAGGERRADPGRAPAQGLAAGDLAELRRAVSEAQQGLARLSHRIERIILR